MKFSDFVCFKAIIPELKAKDRDGAITELVNALVKGRQAQKRSVGGNYQICYKKRKRSQHRNG